VTHSPPEPIITPHSASRLLIGAANVLFVLNLHIKLKVARLERTAGENGNKNTSDSSEPKCLKYNGT